MSGADAASLVALIEVLMLPLTGTARGRRLLGHRRFPPRRANRWRMRLETNEHLKGKDMTNKDKPSTSPAAPKAAQSVRKTGSQIPEHDTLGSADNGGQQTDRPGFDLGGSTGDTHAGTGLGLGEDAFDTPGARRLPGRQIDNKLTIPRWSGPEPRNATTPEKKTAEVTTAPESSIKKDG